MAVTYVSSTITTVVGNSITRSANINGQDLICLAHIHYESSTDTSDLASSGFTQDATDYGDGGGFEKTRVRFAWKIASGTAGSQTTEASSYSIDNSGSQYQILALWAMRGHDPTTPIQATSTVAHGTGTSMSVAGITVSKNGSTGLWIKGGYGGATSTDPSGFTAIVADLDGVNDVHRKDFNAGATGSITATQGSGGWVNIFAIVQPPGAGGGLTCVPNLVGHGF